MSSFSKRSIRKRYSQHLSETNKKHVSMYMKHKLARVKELQQTMQSLCDSNSTSNEDSCSSFKFNFMNSSKTGDHSTIHKSKSSDEDSSKKLQNRRDSSSIVSEDSENDYHKQKLVSSKEHSKLDKRKSNMKNKKTSFNNVRKGKQKSKELENSDSEDEMYEKCSTRRKNRHSTLKSTVKGFVSLPKEEADSSTSKEFQKLKLSRHTDLVKEISETEKDDESDLFFTEHTEEKTMISKEQSLCFKSHVIKILNKFKEVCSQYELCMENIKSKHLKKELLYQESASNVISKSKSVITKLKTELDVQEKELTDFYKKWSKSSSLKSIVHDNSSLSENEIFSSGDKEGTNKLKISSNVGSMVSEFDHEQIFSSNETVTSKLNTEEIKKNENSVSVETLEKLVDDGNSENMTKVNPVISPILSSNKEKEISNKIHVKNDSKMFNAEAKQMNESVDDIFEDSTTENVDAQNVMKSNQNELEMEHDLKSKIDNNETITTECSNNKNKSFLEDEDSSMEVDKSLSTYAEKSTTPTPKDSQKTLKLVDKTKTDSFDEPDDEEQTKRAMLESDSETSTNEESSIEKLAIKSTDDSLKEKSRLQSKSIKSNNKKQKNKMQTNTIYKDSSCSLDEQDEIARIENSVKRTLLDSNSDDSIDHSCNEEVSGVKNKFDDNRDEIRAKTKLLVSSNSESCSSDSDSKSQVTKVDISLKKRKKEDENGDEDFTVDKNTSDFEINVNEKEKNREACSVNNNNFESDQKLKMLCQVVVDRLSKKTLEEHRDELEQSRQYLECKQIKSLIDLDRLQRNHERTSNFPRNSPSKKNTKAIKETKDSLLNHLEKVENGEFSENAEENSSIDCIFSPSRKVQDAFQTNDELILEADRATKNILLNSSDSDSEERKIASENDDSEQENNKTKLKDHIKKSPQKTEKEGSDKENEDEREKNKWRRNKLLTMKFSSDSDSDAEREKWNIKQKKLRENAEERNTDSSDTKDASIKRRRRNRKIIDSDFNEDSLDLDHGSDTCITLEDKSSDTDSSIGNQRKRIRKRKTRKSSDTDSSFEEKRPKPKRKRIKNITSDSDDTDNDQITNSQGTPGKKGRKNIRRVIKDKQVASDTKQAAKEEEERLKRIAERQKLYNEMYEARLASEEKVDKLVLDFNPETKEELVSVHESLVKSLKPHQAKGIKFMWDACFESLERIKSSSGSGCIIAHCMGLGKTLQVIALVHTLLTCKETGIRTVMIVCPLSTVLNWLHEFNLWLKDIEDNDIEVYEMTKFKKNIERKYQLEGWQRTGGVLLIGYEMFRNLSGINNKKIRKNAKETILKCLIDPGPDVIVCDEGHLLKNEDTALSKSMNRIKTLRRIVLTGTPLQNNLIEYHCMVQFIKPNLLGTRKEFLNRFANPISNGQFDDSTEYDVKLMKKRAYVLNKMLKGCIQRFDYSVLTPFLPPKQEYVIFVSLTEVQINLYQHYLDNFARRQRAAGGSLFADFQALQRIWTHPIVLRLNAEKLERVNGKKYSSDSEGSLRDFIDDSELECTSSTSTSSSDEKGHSTDCNATTKDTTNSKTDVEVISTTEKNEKNEENWWLQFTQPEHFEDMRISSKLVLLFGILKECEQIGDKVLVFSQSLYSLTLIEQFLEKIDNETQQGTSSEYIDGHTGSWSLGLDYFRLDGQTSAEKRNIYCKIFNKPSNTRARLFLISTRAGGLGINLTAANRVIIFDASWNPSHDVQSIFRVFRFGQKKPCYVYRFLAAGTMEEKIYNRQVTKLSLSCRVVDEQQIERHYSNHDLSELYSFEPNINNGQKPTLSLPKDRLLAEIFLKYKNFVENYHEHDSLLENKAEEELNEEERKQAWLEYEEEKKGKAVRPPLPAMAAFQSNGMLNQFNLPAAIKLSADYKNLEELIRKDYPNATPERQQMMTASALTDMYSYWEQQMYNSANQMRNQVPTSIQIPYGVPNTNTNLTGQIYRSNDTRPGVHNMNTNLTGQRKEYRNNDTEAGNGDDDVVEIPPTTISNTNTNKSQEE